ncbi:tyrosine-type recombinase/integrase [Neobacillus sp. OS1-33]|jgi:integrase|uniref:tyrosine-type recombinase/integrase n=1 Tax=Neobacillus sp. OS1-33 TaxID=3070683 RepID=UPI0027DF2428|nr:tyrosine-type recombinase/integrase [Neobacillus sp. OS1-33]WML25321.1 tyrosine-type recombinase/integrase [Neobacillus sp. OS1-33]WML26854.1 tyrosine-type recombinase/integrase [Neobacillus sp. OS1-33]WML26925.1 tyrosine-type recombinase/integrase [Neobacillus sp. OS1-33]WML28129.1 tyrosine-type recombinase/integrase [Neobacillus sp. OS1-33]WML28300.1 tyrosine-type recombinase/integrase [Neobacillus sp. OS1-33]
MKVQEIIVSGNRKRYLLQDNHGEFVKPVVKFLKYMDNTGSSRNTLRSYCFALKLFFEFLEQKQADYRDIGIDNMAEFVRWLQNPYRDLKVINIKQTDVKTRKACTINIYLDKVYSFYDYLMRHEDYALDLSERLKSQILASRGSFKGFLHHTLKNKSKNIMILKLKEPREKLKVLTSEQVQKLVDACRNVRDKFLLALLYETGIRIGEALSLHLSDIVPAAKKITIRDRGELINGAEIKTICSPRTLDISNELANLYRAYIIDIHTDEIDTNFVFIKLRGEQKGSPLDYHCIQALFNRLKAKTGIDATPHMLRHTNITELWKTGEMRPETLQKRAGHAHVQTTIQMYIHPSEDDIRNDWEKAMMQKQLREEKNEE